MMPRTLAVVAAAIAVAAAGASAAAPKWNVTIPEFASVGMSVTATASKTLISFVGNSGSGSAVVRSTDGGEHWTQLPAPQAGAFLGGSAVGHSAVGASMFGLYYSDEASAYNFSTSKGLLGLTSQSVEAFGEQSYGATGQQLVGGGDGAAVSTDGGATFTFSNASALTTSARYGAFPSATTWFLSAGTWPENKAQEGGIALTQRITLRADAEGVTGAELQLLEPRSATPPPANGSSSSGWAAQIVKTTDGGKTWESVYTGEGFYFNQIDCASETSCVAVGESDGTEGGSAGVRIFTTTDGGSTWKRTFFSPDAQDSLMAVRFASATEVWAAGGHLSQTDFEGLLLHSTDAGATWTQSSLAGVYPVSLTFASTTEGYATALNAESVTSFLTYA